jgi:CBS domain-containing protein
MGGAMTTLAEIMTKDVFTASSETAVADAAKAMVRGRFGSALVLQSAQLVGIFTERDVLRAAASGHDLNAARVSEWMTRDPETATSDADADDAAQLMLSRGFRHLPVVDGNDVVGVVSLRDVLSVRVGRH